MERKTNAVMCIIYGISLLTKGCSEDKELRVASFAKSAEVSANQSFSETLTHKDSPAKSARESSSDNSGSGSSSGNSNQGSSSGNSTQGSSSENSNQGSSSGNSIQASSSGNSNQGSSSGKSNQGSSSGNSNQGSSSGNSNQGSSSGNSNQGSSSGNSNQGSSSGNSNQGSSSGNSGSGSSSGNSNQGRSSSSSGSDTGAACFPGDTEIETRTGLKKVRNIQNGEEIKTVNLADNSIGFSKVLFHLHSNNSEIADGIKLVTEKGRTLTATEDHLIFVSKKCRIAAVRRSKAVFMRNAEIGDCVFVKSPSNNNKLTVERIKDISNVEITGVFAPVTEEGTILVNSFAASCYAFIEDHYLMLKLFWMFRYVPSKGFEDLQRMFNRFDPKDYANWILNLKKKMKLHGNNICFQA